MPDYSRRLGDAAARSGRKATESGAPLSTVHTPPFVEYVAGASVLRASRAIVKAAPAGGKRGRIKGFSRSSRRRLMVKISSVEKGAMLPVFVTLTWPDEFPSPAVSKQELDIFLKRLRRSFPSVGLIWKLEPQQRGAPHYHMLCWGSSVDELQAFVPKAWFDIAGQGDYLHLAWHMGLLGSGNIPCCQQVRSRRGMLAYASKYLGKTFDVSGWADKWTGRYWSVVNPACIPFGRVVRFDVAMSKALSVMRYGRRFARLPGRDYASLTVLCDADQWVERLGITGEIPGSAADPGGGGG